MMHLQNPIRRRQTGQTAGKRRATHRTDNIGNHTTETVLEETARSVSSISKKRVEQLVANDDLITSRQLDIRFYRCCRGRSAIIYKEINNQNNSHINREA